MNSTYPGRRGPVRRRSTAVSVLSDTVVQVAVVAVVAAALGSVRPGGDGRLDALTFAAGVASTILVGVGGWLGGDRRARWAAAAIALNTAAVLAPATWPVLLSGPIAVAVAMTGLLVVLTAAGGCAYLRRCGVALCTGGAALLAGVASGSSGTTGLIGICELAAAVMLLVAGLPYLVRCVRSAERQQESTRTRLVAAEAAAAAAAERDHELRNVVAGLSGAATTLADGDLAATPAGRQLLVAAGAELVRLQAMLSGGSVGGEQEPVAVGPLLSDLALLRRSMGHDVRVDVVGEPRAVISRDDLAQALTNLLVNCARHAPGSPVRLRARPVGPGTLRIEVVDDGPGIDAGVETVTRRGVRRLGSPGSGLGLAITAEIVEAAGGALRLVSPGRGCTAVMDVPAAADTSHLVMA